jgi:hypothetical protein
MDFRVRANYFALCKRCFPGINTQQLRMHPVLGKYTFTIRLFIDSQYINIRQKMHLLYRMLFLERTLRNSPIVKEPTIQHAGIPVEQANDGLLFL